jgi:hypothetical protein
LLAVEFEFQEVELTDAGDVVGLLGPAGRLMDGSTQSIGLGSQVLVERDHCITSRFLCMHGQNRAIQTNHTLSADMRLHPAKHSGFQAKN